MKPETEPLASPTSLSKGGKVGSAIALIVVGALLAVVPFVVVMLRLANTEMTWVRWAVVLACGGLVCLMGAGLAGLGVYILRHRHDEAPQTDFGRQAEMWRQKPFKPAETTIADEAANMLLGPALHLHTPHCSLEKIERDFASLQTEWSARELFQGSESELHSVLLRNLRRIRETPGFRVFKVSVMLHDSAAQIDAMFTHHFVGIRVWKSGSVHFACGNSEFRSTPA